MPAAQQLNLLDSLRTPDAVYAHFKAKGECLHCRLPLRHELHAFNHWKRYHRPKPVLKKRYWKLSYVGNQLQWEEVSRVTHRMAKKLGLATAISRPS